MRVWTFRNHKMIANAGVVLTGLHDACSTGSITRLPIGEDRRLEVVPHPWIEAKAC
jgi:hypothetical protein